MKLFAIYIGGAHPRANIEVHDMRFVVANTILETYDELRRQWWGRPGSLHIDCWAEIDHADGYDVSLHSDPFEGLDRLFYVNMGGYDPSEFSEKHKNVFIVAPSLAQAKVRAMESSTGWHLPHRDNIYEAEQAFALNDLLATPRLHLHLSQTGNSTPMSFTCAYTPIKTPAKVPRALPGRF